MFVQLFCLLAYNLFRDLGWLVYANNFYGLNFHSLPSTIVSSFSLDATLFVVNNHVMSFAY